MNAFDLLVLIALQINTYGGFKNGFIRNVFKSIGYIAGGVAGVTIGLVVMGTWSNHLAKAAGTIIFIFLLAKVGESIFDKIGLGSRRVLLISPFKFLDSLVGAALSIIHTVFISHLLAVIPITTPWSIGNRYIASSKFYIYTDSHLPKVITELKTYDNKFLIRFI